MPDKHASPPHAVDRPALRRQLDVGVRSPLTLLVAPAGAGKTVLLAQWVASRPDLIVKWFDVTSADADAAHFSQRLVRALEDVDPVFSQLAAPLGEPRGGLGAALVDALVVALGEVDGEIVIVLDDLHHLSNRALADDLWKLAGRLPRNAHLLVSSRVDPGTRLSRLRLEHALVEVRQAQLVLSAAEIDDILRRLTGDDIAAGTAAAVAAHTEGWAAGVQLAGLTLRFRTDEASLIGSLSETDRLVLDYLSEEVLDAQPPERRAALLALSIPDEISSELARDLAGLDAPEDFLRGLVDQSMFLAPVDGRTGTYRFHHLFRDILRYRLRAEDPDLERALLERAATWYADQDDAPAAIECLLRARAWSEAIDLILASGRDTYERGHVSTLTRWLAAVPADVRARNTDAEMLYGISVGMSSNAVEGVSIMRGLLRDERLTVGGRIVAHAYIAAAVQFLPHPELFLAEAQRALELLDGHPDASFPHLMGLGNAELLRTLAVVSAGRALLLAGRLHPARAWLARGLATPGAQYTPYTVHLVGSTAMLEAVAGRLRLASERADEALELARASSLLTHPACADSYFARAIVAIQRGEPEAGAMALEEGMRRALANNRGALAWVGVLGERLISPSADDDPTALPDGPPPPLVANALAAVRYRLQREAGSPSTSIPRQTSWSTLAFEEVASLLARNDLAGARERLAALPTDAEHASVLETVERGVCTAWLHSLEGRTTSALAELCAAIDVAEPEGLLGVFVRAGAPIARLAADLPGPRTPFRRAIERSMRAAVVPVADELPEPLTARERELLAYLPTRLTNVELAQKWYVSVNTIKTHVTHIYRKLGVQGRTAAVERAQELGLLDPENSPVRG